MKILHTSDWHIGKKLMGRDRSDEFRAVLGEIAEICERESVDLCLVAGDVFDTYTPSAEAERIFFETVQAIAKFSAVLVISGNHDDYVRLTASALLAEQSNIYIIGNNLQAVHCRKTGRCYPVESEQGYVVFENAVGDRVYVDTLPYPNEARFREGRSEESFGEKMSRWIGFGERGKVEGTPSIFLSHIFVAGGVSCESEREIDLGGARLVPAEILPDCDYAALGHLHKRQNLGKNVCYSGSIMRFSFDESNAVKSVNLFELTASGVQNFRQIELKKIKNLVRLQALSAESGLELLKSNGDSYAELTLNLTEPLTRAQIAALNGCGNLVSLKTEIAGAESTEDAQTRKDKSASELFVGYYKSRFGAEPSDELKTLFLELTEEQE